MNSPTPVISSRNMRLTRCAPLRFSRELKRSIKWRSRSPSWPRCGTSRASARLSRGMWAYEEEPARRVLVTGLGPVSSIGIGARHFAASLRAGRCGPSPIRSFDPAGFPYSWAGEVHNFDPGRLLRRLDPAGWGRSSQFAAAAARLAADDAGLDAGSGPADRMAVVMGTT